MWCLVSARLTAPIARFVGLTAVAMIGWATCLLCSTGAGAVFVQMGNEGRGRSGLADLAQIESQGQDFLL